MMFGEWPTIQWIGYQPTAYGVILSMDGHVSSYINGWLDGIMFIYGDRFMGGR